ncbi:MAG: hypothetical protein IH602_13680 [Bryobacteraceae bacterium]|nr:hypothetical protein [Bryobacteraceae bacterium]
MNRDRLPTVWNHPGISAASHVLDLEIQSPLPDPNPVWQHIQAERTCRRQPSPAIAALDERYWGVQHTRQGLSKQRC